MQILDSWIFNARIVSAQEPFSERFKYNVISSSLLSSDITSINTPSQYAFDTSILSDSPISLSKYSDAAAQATRDRVSNYISRSMLVTGSSPPIFLAYRLCDLIRRRKLLVFYSICDSHHLAVSKQQLLVENRCAPNGQFVLSIASFPSAYLNYVRCRRSLHSVN